MGTAESCRFGTEGLVFHGRPTQRSKFARQLFHSHQEASAGVMIPIRQASAAVIGASPLRRPSHAAAR